MAVPQTKNGYNMYDMLSYMQKAIRRGKFNDAGFAANEIETTFRRVMWNRLLVISSEDCFGVLTKELIALKELDDRQKDNKHVANAIALMCKSYKSRDACYFSCNFVLATRCPRPMEFTQKQLDEIEARIPLNPLDDGKEYDECGFEQMTIFDMVEQDEEKPSVYVNVLGFQKALDHKDMDMIGYYANEMRYSHRNLLWDAMKDYASNETERDVLDEIIALQKADNIVNHGKQEKDEIFISKAMMILVYANDLGIDYVESSDMINLHETIDWAQHNVKPIEKCYEAGKRIPEWVFDCHTLRGKKAGKTDWDMTVSEQEALTPKKWAYFDDASWLYTYEDDYQTGRESYEHMLPIWKFAETHPVNPVEFIPYEE